MPNIYVCWVYKTRLSQIGCFQKWRKFHSREKAREFIQKITTKKKFMFVRYIYINDQEVESL